MQSVGEVEKVKVLKSLKIQPVQEIPFYSSSFCCPQHPRETSKGGAL